MEYHQASSTMPRRSSQFSPEAVELRLLTKAVGLKHIKEDYYKRSLSLETEEEEEPKGDIPRTMQRQALAGAITTAMTKCLEPLLAAKETKNQTTKYSVRANRLVMRATCNT